MVYALPDDGLVRQVQRLLDSGRLLRGRGLRGGACRPVFNYLGMSLAVVLLAVVDISLTASQNVGKD